MYNFRVKSLSNYFNQIIRLLIFTFLFFIILSIFKYKKSIGYSLFVEFDNTYGIKQGTSVNFRGVQVGYIKNIYMKCNSVILLVHIKSNKFFIPKSSLIEINQTGLFNDTVVDIVPLKGIPGSSYLINRDMPDVFSEKCLTSHFLCNYHYLKGNRGLNYDDLVRATTRISQRFDDPRFFSIVYLFLQNSLEVSDDIIHIFEVTKNILNLFMYSLEVYIFKYIV